MERKNLSVTFHARTYNIINPRLKNNSTSFINFTSPLAQYISINIHNYIHSPPKTYCQVIGSNSKACIFERASLFHPFCIRQCGSPLKKRKRKRNVHHSRQKSGRSTVSHNGFEIFLRSNLETRRL